MKKLFSRRKIMTSIFAAGLAFAIPMVASAQQKGTRRVYPDSRLELCSLRS